MASSATTVIAKMRQIYPDCSTTDAQTLLEDVIKEIYLRLPARNTEIDISLTDGTQEYNFDVDVTRIQQVVFKETASVETWVRLDATNIDKLGMTEPDWRLSDTEGSPTTYYITSAVDSDTAKPMIGFLPIPDTTTAAGYPKVTCYVTKYAAISSSETMPSNFLNDKVVMYGMARDWAVLKNKDNDIAKWQKLFEMELAKNEVHMSNLYENENELTIAGPVFSLTKRV